MTFRSEMAMNFLDEKLPIRFWDKVIPEPNSGCWLWTGATMSCGYGSFGMGSKSNGTRRPHLAHRVSYSHLVGEIPDGLHLDHLCRNRCCVNPAHLEPVTNAENTRRGAAGHEQSAKTHCPAGHPYDGGNLFFIPNQTRSERSRCCRQCKNARNAAYRARQKKTQ